MLSPSQTRALRAVAARAHGPSLPPHHRVCVHLHPDRLHGGVPLLAALARDGVLRSQFETGTSNGGLTAHPGGDRWRWESRIFDGAYDDAPAAERPKYGALDRDGRPHGPATRFGSAHLRLAAHTLARTTFCFPDSVFEPDDFGTADAMPLLPLAAVSTRDLLDDYIEAQVHGALSLADDVEAIVLDPCYRGTEVERLARALPCALAWHPGFVLSCAELEARPDYRGPEVVALGRSLARDGVITPAVLGDAARTGAHDPQTLKRVWHHVARFGAQPRGG